MGGEKLGRAGCRSKGQMLVLVVFLTVVNQSKPRSRAAVEVLAA